MGLRIDREHFEDEDFARFGQRLDECLEALRQLLDRPGFGDGAASLGAELELFLVDAVGRPLPRNQAVLAETLDPRVTVELDRFNLECNLRPSPLAGRPFTALAGECEDALREVSRAARAQQGRVAMIGILPTLCSEDLQASAMTDSSRYRALSAGLQRLRRKPFRVNIGGEDPLDIECNDVTFEGANTSLQVHLRVRPADYAQTYNAIQLATAPALSVAGNSPTFLGHRLWEETRVALFTQSVDDRVRGRKVRRAEARVSFGSEWAGADAFELFAETVANHEPLLPILSSEDPLACVRAGGVPGLDEVRVHQGTVWRWNRPIYDPADGGHLRIEMRSFPAGPSVMDMMANTAFLVGLARGLAPESREWIRRVPFATADGNFYRAAQFGLDAELLWPSEPGAPPEPVRAGELVLRLLPVARAGLEGAGVEPDEAESFLAVIEARARVGVTGAIWQRRTLEFFEPRLGRGAALVAMLERYLAGVEGGRPVHEWPLSP